MIDKPLLSICIPTYNRAEFLKDALDSILRQINENNKDKVEICISDNASEDNTEELVEEYQKKSPIPVIYHKNEKNMGADYNYLKVVEIANGEYCWLLGSDDIIKEGGINTILKEIEGSEDISLYIINRAVYDFSLKYRLKETPPKLRSLLMNYNDILIDSIDKLLPFFVYCGYISALVVNKSKWQHILKNNDVEKYFNAYVHTYIVLKMFLEYGNFKYVGKKYILCRAGNDSFLENNNEGVIRRAYIDLKGYEQVARGVFGRESGEYKKALELVSTDIIKTKIWHIKANTKSITKSLKFYIDVIKYYYFIPKFWTDTFFYICMPTIVYKFYNVYKKITRYLF